MSGVVAPDTLDAAVGLALDVALKVTVPLALGLVASALPGSATAKHLRLGLALAATPALAVATAAARGADAAWTADAPAWPLAVWGFGAAVAGAGLVRGLLELRALRTTPGPDGLERCDRVASPVTAGWWRPRILVPADFDAWPPAARAAALAHERAHVRRADWLVHLGAWLLGAGLWFHPLAALARRRLALLAECAADDAVVADGHDAAAYAELLLRLGRPGPALALAVGRSAVGVRVRRLVRPGGRSAGARSSAASALAFVAALGLAVSWTAEAAAWHAPAPVADCAPAPEPALLPVLPDPTYRPWSPTWSPLSSP